MKTLTQEQLPDLPDEVFELLADGVYSLYELDSADAAYLLATTRPREFYFLSASGSVTSAPRGASSPADAPVIGPVLVEGGSHPLRVNVG